MNSEDMNNMIPFEDFNDRYNNLLNDIEKFYNNLIDYNLLETPISLEELNLLDWLGGDTDYEPYVINELFVKDDKVCVKLNCSGLDYIEDVSNENYIIIAQYTSMILHKRHLETLKDNNNTSIYSFDDLEDFEQQIETFIKELNQD